MTEIVEDAVAGRLGRAQQIYFRIIVGLACAAILAMVIIMGVQVFFRYVLNDSIIWTEEVCRYILIWSTFLFAGAAFQRGEMVSLELLVGRFPGLSRLIFIVPAYLASLALLAALVWYGWKFADINSFQTIPAADFIWSSITGKNEEVNLSIFWIYMSVPVGMAIMFVHLALSLVAQVRRAVRGEPLPSPATLEGDVARQGEDWGE